jgi:hypothetical protein
MEWPDLREVRVALRGIENKRTSRDFTGREKIGSYINYGTFLKTLLVKKGRTLAVTGQIRGLHAFWEEMLDAPTQEDNYAALAGFNVGIAAPKVWQAKRTLGTALSRLVTRSSPS